MKQAALVIALVNGLGLTADASDQDPARDAGAMEANWARFPQSKPALGDDAPDFTLTDLDGNAVRLRDFRGKRPVVIEFGSYS